MVNLEFFRNKISVVALAASFLPPILIAQEAKDKLDVFSASLEEVLDVKVTVASKGKSQSIRNAAGSILVYDAAAIKLSGARDLLEFLKMVPGFYVFEEVTNATQVKFRGGQSYLLRIDGLEMTDLSFQGTQVDGYLLDSVERIEIIRGPGSVLYGDVAENAVIDITTKKPDSEFSGSIAADVGATEKFVSREEGTVRAGSSWGSGFLNVQADVGNIVRASGNYEDFYGESYSYEKNMTERPRWLNVGLKQDDFTFRYVHDDYEIRSRDIFYISAPFSVPIVSSRDILGAFYEPKINDDLRASFKATYNYATPAHVTSQKVRELELANPDSYAGIYYDKQVERWQSSGDLVYSPISDLSLLAGAQFQRDKGRGTDINYEPIQEYKATREALYAEATYSPSLINVVAGTRWDHDHDYGGELVSRFALTKSTESWHAKAQYAEAFKAPGFEQVNSAADPDGQDENYVLKPEKIRLVEIEVGARVTDNSYLTLSVFDAKTTDWIAFFYDTEKGDAYGNVGTNGYRGAELTARYNDARWDVAVTYEYSEATDLLSDFSVVDSNDGELLTSDEFLGQSHHNAWIRANYRLVDDINIHTALRFRGPMYQYTHIDENETPVPERIDPDYVWNTNVVFTDVGMKNLDVNVGVNNILDRRHYGYPQYYTSSHPAFNQLGREYVVGLKYRW